MINIIKCKYFNCLEKEMLCFYDTLGLKESDPYSFDVV